MKKLLVVSLAMVCFGLGWELRPSMSGASIALSTPYTKSGPNVSVETDAYVAPMAICADQTTGILSLTIYPATSITLVAGKTTGLTLGTMAPVVITINTNTGNWGSTGGQSGTLTGSNLTGAQGWIATALTATMKDQAEAWFIANGTFPGTQPNPW